MKNFRNKFKKNKNKFKKKYKNISLFLLVIFSFVLNTYNQNIILKDKNVDEEDEVSFLTGSDKYGVFDKGYAYVKDDTDIEIQSNVSIISYKTVVEGDMLNFYKWSTPDYSYPIVRLDFENLNVIDNKIYINNSISYEEFINNIITNTTYKIYDNNTEVTSGNITVGMQLKIYYNEEEIDSYIVSDDYINLDNLNIKDNKYVIKNISTVWNLKKEINTSGNIMVYDKDNNLLANSDYITTASKLKIELSNKTYEYTIVVIGDITGSGDIFIGDISKLYSYYKNTIDMEECYIIAGDVTYDNIIEINDIAKLYQYYKGTINSLN